MIGPNKIISRSPEETIIFGKDFAKTLEHGQVIGLFGNLGSGKTQFVKGICEYFDVKDTVNSPTFVIVNEYDGVRRDSGDIFRINHIDLYRLKTMNELVEIGIENYAGKNSVCIIEWAELADEYFKGRMRKLHFEHGAVSNERFIRKG